ncbi:MAG: ABC transporter ATP-binding protein [Caldilineaceae bacterium]|nr:ABC transporter ATP-binding protein [Caldilineaceae bacterium]
MTEQAIHTQPTTESLPIRRYLWQLLRYQPWHWLLTLFAYLVLYGLNFVPPLLIRLLFDRLTGEATVAWSLWTFVALLVGATIGRQSAYVALMVGQHLYLHLTSALVRANLFEQILAQPGAQALPTSPGEAVSRFRDDIRTSSNFLSSAFNLIGLSAFVLPAMVTMLRIDALLTLLAFLPLLVISVAIHQGRARIIRFREANQMATGRVTGFLGEMFGAVQAIQLADAEGTVVAHLQAINEGRRQAALKDRLVAEIFQGLGGNLGDIGAAIILLVMGQAMRTGQFTVGDFALFTFVMPFVAGNVGSVAGVLTSYRQLGVSLRRLEALLQGARPQTLVQHRPVYLLEPAPVPPTRQETIEPLETLTVSGLTYHYPGSNRGIDNLSFELRRGSFTVITGQIGAGKSTLVRTLLGLLPKSAGEVRWNGQLIPALDTFFVPPRSAYTPQTPRLFSASLRENILLGLAESAVDIPAALQASVLQQDLARLTDGLETKVGPRGVRLSGGQIQRAAAARMFVRAFSHTANQGASLLVLDDLASALDVETEQQLWKNLDQFLVSPHSHLTCLVVSHRRAALQRADQIILLHAGKIAGIGSLATLLQTNQAMQQLWHSEG